MCVVNISVMSDRNRYIDVLTPYLVSRRVQSQKRCLCVFDALAKHQTVRLRWNI